MRNNYSPLLALLLWLATANAFLYTAVKLKSNDNVNAFPAITKTKSFRVTATKSTTCRRMSTRPGSAAVTSIKGGRRPKPVFLVHERDFFRQMCRLESMDSYVLVSTLTASMSFGALLGYSPSTLVFQIKSHTLKLMYQALCLAIQVISGISALCGLYATIIFSLTILYSKSALGAERDREYDKFIRKTVRARVHGFRSFCLSLGLFAVEVFLVLVEKASFSVCSLPVFGIGGFVLFYLFRDWNLLRQTAEVIYKD